MTKISQDVQQVFSKKLYERVTDLMFGEGVSKEKGRDIANVVRNAFDEACQEQDAALNVRTRTKYKCLRPKYGRLILSLFLSVASLRKCLVNLLLILGGAMGEITNPESMVWYCWTPQAGLLQVHIDWAEGALEEMQKEKKAAHRRRAGLRLVVNR